MLGGAAVLGAQSVRAQGLRQDAGSVRIDEEFVTEPSRRIPVLLTTDVLVVGGGPAGVAAAVSAARAGARVTLLERYNHLGGLWTGGLVLPVNCTHGKGREGGRVQAIHGICAEMTERLAKMNMSIREVNPIVDPEATKSLLDLMMAESGVEVVYHCYVSQAIVEDDTVKGVFTESKSGRQAVLARVVVDCSGDGDVVSWAGEDFDLYKYNIALASRLGNCDKVDKGATGYRAVKLGLTETPTDGVIWKSMWGEENQDGLDVRNLSRLQQKLRMEIWHDYEKVHATPGYEKVFVLDIASQLGVRATRVLKGRYRLTLDDSMTYRTFKDCIGVSGAWTHIPYRGRSVKASERPVWQIPYGSIVPRKTRNLLVAGRCFSFDKGLLEDAREIGTCLVTGQAAGVAAALAVSGRTSVQEVDVEKLKKTLTGQHVWLGE